MIFLFNWAIFRFHENLQGCIQLGTYFDYAPHAGSGTTANRKTQGNQWHVLSEERDKWYDIRSSRLGIMHPQNGDICHSVFSFVSGPAVVTVGIHVGDDLSNWQLPAASPGPSNVLRWRYRCSEWNLAGFKIKLGMPEVVLSCVMTDDCVIRLWDFQSEIHARKKGFSDPFRWFSICWCLSTKNIIRSA